MLSIRLLAVGLIFFVLALALCPVPAGQGPFSAAFGPATKFQALQALLLLLFLTASAALAAQAMDGVVAPFARLATPRGGSPVAPSRLEASSSVLRC